MMPAPLRIAHVTNEPFGCDTANGVQHAVYCLARAQAATGQLVAVFTRDDEKVHVIGDQREPSVARRAGRVRRSRPSLRSWLLSSSSEEGLADEILAWHPDVVHFHSVHIPQNVALAAHLRRARVPYCVTVHGGLYRDALRRGWLKKVVFRRLFELRYLDNALFIQALSDGEVEVVRSLGIEAPVVLVTNGLPPGTDLPSTRPEALFAEHPRLTGQRVFMFIGRLDPWQKGLDLLLHAFAEVRPGGVLVLVGPDYHGSRRRLEALAHRLGVPGEVVFLDAAFGADRSNLLAAASVFVHPSRWEGASLSVLAAAASGKPCLVTRAADPLGELERAEAAIVVDATIASVRDGLRKVAALDDEQLQAMGTRARTVAGQFSWSSAAVTLSHNYRRALGRRNGDAGAGAEECPPLRGSP